MSGNRGGKDRRGLTEDESADWAAFTRKIKPLAPKPKVSKPAATESPPRPAARKVAAVKAAAAASASAPAPKVPPPLATLTRREKQRVARGRDGIDARLDLHGHTQSEAHSALLGFLRNASDSGARLVLVITGKSGVLRQQVPLWLALPDFRALAISTEQAAIRHGGEGALYVRVRRAR